MTDESAPRESFIGDCIDPLVWSGIVLIVLEDLPLVISLQTVMAALMLSVLWIQGVMIQPVRRSLDRLSSEVVAYAE